MEERQFRMQPRGDLANTHTRHFDILLRETFRPIQTNMLSTDSRLIQTALRNIRCPISLHIRVSLQRLESENRLRLLSKHG
jgi:hypothetical protein